MKSSREHLHTCLTERLYNFISHLTLGHSREEAQRLARWFASTMMYFVELYTTGWKEPTLEELQETIRQITADLILLDAFEEVILED